MDNQAIMAALILVVAIILLIGMMRNKLRHGSSCCGEHEAPESKVKVADKNINHYDNHYEATIDGMVCGNCATRVENALNRNDGIYARVDLGNKKATIHAKKTLSKDEVVGYLKELPYTLVDFNQK
ncbi:MAG: cation transporter [Butyrivibrio sp.]|nr:cation transporter [Butyrivibrio sp.]